VFLAIPNARDNAANIGLDPAKAGPAVRFVATSSTVPDQNTGRNETAVTWARGNLRLMFGTEPRDAYQAVRIGAARARSHRARSSSARSSSRPSSTSAPPST
jgi:type VI secretion system protein ImpJ